MGDLISICIASIGRRTLVDTICSVDKSAAKYGFNIEYIIADDSPNKAVTTLLSQAMMVRENIKIIDVASRNISIARNACLKNSSGKYLAFIDDDEIADINWLGTLHSALTSNNVDGVFGAILPIHDPAIPQWIVKSSPFLKFFKNNNARVETGGTGNLLMKSQIVKETGLSFNQDFGRTGGEDTLFFYELNKAGYIFICENKSIVNEHVTPDRVVLSKLFKRYCRGGQTYAYINNKGHGPIRRAKEFVNGLIKLIVSSIFFVLVFPVNKSTGLVWYLKMAANYGKIKYFAGAKMDVLY
ncbi:hypothetical protein BJN45_08230 [Azonexus hydrophilus]|uniref:Glycosyltransferase 2-like domain-containing protein n=2 Tax=Azonexus hydrophilus TaxID=418702 RepID=A0A1R1I8X1_9RHOO|nr:hypothetical protein BJN45_08230 [Azonexus hydrophilus]